ncbi:MAG: PstS family phosphate ABC transporter substrate-binding protein [Gemmatimonadetes bacterium]|nr:PstS family phosphate ABC transporter substrate-binding protein [Gemmatimonadota bacterium]
MNTRLRGLLASGSLGAPGARFVGALVFVGLLGACADSRGDPWLVTVGGSSTVYPLMEAMIEDFRARRPEFRVTIGVSGTSGGLRRLCAGELDLAAASRDMTTRERERCRAAAVRWVRFPIALDGLTVVVNEANQVADCLTTTELRQIWEPASQVVSWRDVRPDFPEEPIHLYGPGTNSGTFDFFNAVIVGRPQASRSDYYQTEDDFQIVRGVAGDPWALGYFGHAYYARSNGGLRALRVDFGSGCVEPSPRTIADGDYGPLTRELALFVNEAGLARLELRDFLDAVLRDAESAAREVGYVPLPGGEYRRALDRLDSFERSGGA